MEHKHVQAELQSIELASVHAEYDPLGKSAPTIHVFALVVDKRVISTDQN